MSQRNALYRFYSTTGQLLYVGITSSPDHRFKQHQQDKPWWAEVAGISIETFPSRAEVESAERRAILVEHPRYNIQRPALRPIEPEPPEEVTPEPDELDDEQPSEELRLPWRCQECDEPIDDYDGGAWIDINECRDVEQQERTWEQTYVKDGAYTLGDLFKKPANVRWHIDHIECAPDLTEKVIYHVDIHELRTYSGLLWWTAHLSEKDWLQFTNWMALVQRAATGELWAPRDGDDQ